MGKAENTGRENMIDVKENLFVLHTRATTYAFRIIETGQPEHLYYGKRIRIDERSGARAIGGTPVCGQGNTIIYDNDHHSYTLEKLCLEFSSLGKGDIREPFVSVIYPDGSATSDFQYDSYEVVKGCVEMASLPSAYDETGNAETLILHFKERRNDVTLDLFYTVFEDCDVITRRAVVSNDGLLPIMLKRLMSAQVDFPEDNFIMTQFHGSWSREMERIDIKTSGGKLESGSRMGTSSSRSNPFIMLSKESTTENAGSCYGFNLIYSGNHSEMAEVNAYHKLRFMTGIQPEGFTFILNPKGKFESPEAVMTYGHAGYNSLSRNMHEFVREHIVRGEWKRKYRPILLNSWEAAYFDINEEKLVGLATKAKEAGIELFVMDDGWFGERNDDLTSLGDWDVNPAKLPNGLKGLCDRINVLGLSFGLWVEPEMVNVKSKLYEAHPDWCIAIPGAEHSEGRNQRILDLTRTEVVEYVIEAMSKVFSSANISYVKWDMNRIFSDCYSSALPPEKQGEVFHRYVCGLYQVLKALTERFPQILFEGCSSGGNRFDLGMLAYFPQIWGSDNTDAITRVMIQNGYTYAYPPESIGAHVSASPNHQTIRKTPLETRFAVASFGAFGYEYNLCALDEKDFAVIRLQVALYKKWREVMQYGAFYRGRNFDNGNYTDWMVVSKDQKRAVGMVVQKLLETNQPDLTFYAKGLKEDGLYRFSCKVKPYAEEEFAALEKMTDGLNAHPEVLLEDSAFRMVRINEEMEDFLAYGDTLMEAGAVLSPKISGTGYNEKVMFLTDFGARMYFMEEV